MVDKYRGCGISALNSGLYAICTEIEILTENVPATQGLTRRELLKRGALIGGALAWATPAVQLIGMQPALASHVSELCFCVKDESEPIGSGPLVPLGGSSGECLRADRQGCTDTPPTLDGEFSVTNNGNGSYTIEYPANCELIAVSIKCGGGSPDGDCLHEACDCQFLVTPDPESNETSNFFTVFDSDCKNETSVSHIEMCFRC